MAAGVIAKIVTGPFVTALLEALKEDNRLDASAIKNLPAGGGGGVTDKTNLLMVASQWTNNRQQVTRATAAYRYADGNATRLPEEAKFLYVWGDMPVIIDLADLEIKAYNDTPTGGTHYMSYLQSSREVAIHAINFAIEQKPTGAPVDRPQFTRHLLVSQTYHRLQNGGSTSVIRPQPFNVDWF